MSLRLMGTNTHGRASIQSSHVSISTTQVKQSDCNLKALLESGMSGLEVYPNSSLLDWEKQRHQQQGQDTAPTSRSPRCPSQSPSLPFFTITLFGEF